MRFKLTLVLLLANLVVFFALWRLDRPAPINLKPSGLIQFAPNHITITDHLRNEVRELVRDPGGNWRLVQPVQWDANENAVDHLINYLLKPDEQSTFSADDTAQGGQPLSDYGLANPPHVEITVEGPGGKSVHLWIGNATPAGNNLYVMNPADHTVRVWTQDFLASVETPVSDLRDPQIFSIPVFQIQGLSIWSPKLVKFSSGGKNTDQWQLDTPLQRPADSQQVTRVLGQLHSLTAVSFLAQADINLARQGLASPSLSVELKGENGSQKLLLGDPVPNTPVPQYYAKRDDSTEVFIVNGGEPFDTLREAQDKLRQRQFFDFAPEKVSTLSVRVFDAEVRLLKGERPGDPWQIQSKDAAAGNLPLIEADPDIVHSLLDDLRNLSAKSFTTEAPDDLKTYGLDQPSWKVSLQIDKTTLNLDIGRTTVSPYHYYAKLENADSVYEIDRDIIGDLSVDPLHYRNRILKLLPAITTKISSVKLTRLKADLTTDGEPLFNLPVDSAKSLDDQLKDLAPTPQKNIRTLLTWLRNAAVDSYLQSSFDEHTPFPLPLENSGASTKVPWSYRLDVGLETPAVGQTPAQNQTLTLYFTERYGSQQFGGTHTPEVIFQLPYSISALLGTFTSDASLPPAAAQTLREMDTPIDARPTLPAPTPVPTPVPAPASTPAATTAP